MQKNIYKIPMGKLTTYISDSYSKKKYNFIGFTVEREPEFFYCDDLSSIQNYDILKEFTPIQISAYLMNFYKELAYTELSEIIVESMDMNIDDFQLIENDSEYESFWTSAICSAGKDERNDKYIGISVTDVKEGLVSAEIGEYICDYDFVEGKHIAYRKSERDKVSQITATTIFYGKKVNQIIALEQYKNNVASPTYKEFALLNNFLANKKSVKLVMKNGDTYILKNSVLNSRNIIECTYIESERRLSFYIRNNYYLQPRLEKNMSICELDYLQFGKEKHYINADAFDMPQRSKGRRI